MKLLIQGGDILEIESSATELTAGLNDLSNYMDKQKDLYENLTILQFNESAMGDVSREREITVI